MPDAELVERGVRDGVVGIEWTDLTGNPWERLAALAGDNT